jgi:lipopolysaccharide/colanic/teichoic acid biosynthesis glycosyltransferase
MLRRFVDLAAALVILPLLAPAFLVVGVAVVLESPGPVFYGGWRVGKGGKRFRMWKFRTMVTGADRMGGAITTQNDARVTKVGSFLRKTKLDELPQFFNLLLGDLTLIGPRPEAPGLADQYSVEQKQIFQVKPGITGPVQLEYTFLEAETIPQEGDAERFYLDRVLDTKIRKDLDYQRTRTAISDCRVVFQTVSLMVRALTQSNS